jgi:YHS domain-containing protein
VKGPEPYLNDLGIAVACAVHPDREAVIDAAHRVFVNYETFYLSDAATRARFEAAPHEYAGKLTDPVSRARFIPSAGSPRREVGERVFLFASAETAARFDEDPERYATLSFSMPSSVK